MHKIIINDISLNTLGIIKKHFINTKDNYKYNIDKIIKKLEFLETFLADYINGNMIINVNNYKILRDLYLGKDIIQMNLDNRCNELDYLYNNPDDVYEILKNRILNFKIPSSENLRTKDFDFIKKLAINCVRPNIYREYKEYIDNNDMPGKYSFGLLNNINSVDLCSINYCYEESALMYANDQMLHNMEFLKEYFKIVCSKDKNGERLINIKHLEFIPRDMFTPEFIKFLVRQGYSKSDFDNFFEIKKTKKIEQKSNLKNIDHFNIVTIDDVIKNISSKKTNRNKIRESKPKKIDYKEVDIKKIQNGTDAEEYVYETFKKELLILGENELSSKVEWSSKVKGDGLGYDIITYDPITKNEIYVEVKSTEGLSDNFNMSINEISFAENHPNNYKLYWIRNTKGNPQTIILNTQELLEAFIKCPVAYNMVIDREYFNKSIRRK